MAHTGFRNGALFCFNCGKSFKMDMPMAVSAASKMMVNFYETHEKCKKTWVEPKNTLTDKTEVENANWWAINGEHGNSSKTMFNHFCVSIGVRKIGMNSSNYPHDPDDFKRCYKLLEAVPQWKLRMHELKSISPVWSKLVDNWDKLTELFELNEAEGWKNYRKHGMYELMESLGC